MSQHTDHCRSAGEQFLNFTIRFFNLAKASYQQHNQIKANTVAFHAMMRLNQPYLTAPTMSELASELEITKQQLTKLVNDLEEKQLVERQHDHRNRRQVYLTITPTGVRIVQQLKEAMLSCTMAGLSGFTREELSEMDDCLVRLSALLDKFDPQKPQDMDCGDFPQI